MNKLTLAELNKGERFEIVGCEHSFKNLYVKQITESCACIGGERLSDGKWIPLGLNYTITTGVVVNRLEGKVEIVENKEKKETDSPDKGVVAEKSNRGRKPKAITLPDGEFNVKQVVDLNKVSQPCANTHVNELIEKGVLRVTRTVQGRGRPQRFFQRVETPVVFAETAAAVPAEAPVTQEVTENVVSPVVESPTVVHSEPVVVS